MQNKTSDTRGNEYDKAFQIDYNDKVYTFDSFQCAIQLLAPVCNHCEARPKLKLSATELKSTISFIIVRTVREQLAV